MFRRIEALKANTNRAEPQPDATARLVSPTPVPHPSLTTIAEEPDALSGANYVHSMLIPPVPVYGAHSVKVVLSHPVAASPPARR
jgi:hypothetical protein